MCLTYNSLLESVLCIPILFYASFSRAVSRGHLGQHACFAPLNCLNLIFFIFFGINKLLQWQLVSWNGMPTSALTYMILLLTRSRDKTDFDVIRENHKFLWDEEEDTEETWYVITYDRV